ncbi:MAG: hypothetical protein ACOC0C_08050 [Bacteroidota bacterium]
MTQPDIIHWLLEGDVAIQYQTYRDLLNQKKPTLQQAIERQGWGARYLAQKNENGHWGMGFYQLKWTSSHYTILELRNLNISPECKSVRNTLQMILDHEKGLDGGINPSGTVNKSDVCINGMALNYFAYFLMPEQKLHSVVDFILSQQLPDGGFNCQYNRSGAHHSSLHSTISVLEGIQEYKKQGYTYRLDELLEDATQAQEFVLQHRLYKSDKTGNIIKTQFTKLPYPSRWYYDILRALDYFQYARFPYDERIQDAIDLLLKKQRKDYLWNVQAHYPGERFFDMEQAGQASRWNTLRAMRVMKLYPAG